MSRVCWTTKELELLKRYYPQEGATQCALRFRQAGYDRTPDACYRKARELNLRIRTMQRAKRWTPEEDAVLREHHGEDAKAIAKALLEKGHTRTTDQIRKRLEILGLRKAPPRRRGPASLCFSCARAVPHLCAWIGRGRNDMITKRDVKIIDHPPYILVVVQECRNYREGPLPKLRRR